MLGIGTKKKLQVREKNRKMNMGKKVIHTVHELRTIVNNRNIKQVKNKKITRKVILM